MHPTGMQRIAETRGIDSVTLSLPRQKSSINLRVCSIGFILDRLPLLISDKVIWTFINSNANIEEIWFPKYSRTYTQCSRVVFFPFFLFFFLFLCLTAISTLCESFNAETYFCSEIKYFFFYKNLFLAVYFLKSILSVFFTPVLVFTICP